MGRRSAVLNFIRTKKEQKPVECTMNFNYLEGMADYVRLDTGEVVGTRRMTPEEYRGTPLFDESEIQEAEASEAAGPRDEDDEELREFIDSVRVGEDEDDG